MPSVAFERMLTLCEELATSAHFEAAYHALAAAVHIAQDDHDAVALQMAKDVSTTHSAMIDAIAPPHPISTASAQKRGMNPLHESLRRTITVMEAELRVAGEVAEHAVTTSSPSALQAETGRECDADEDVPT